MRRFWYCSAHRLLDLELCRGPSLPCSKPLTVTPKVLSSSGARCCRVLDPADVAPPQQHDTNTARCRCESSQARAVIHKLVSVLAPTNVVGGPARRGAATRPRSPDQCRLAAAMPFSWRRRRVSCRPHTLNARAKRSTPRAQTPAPKEPEGARAVPASPAQIRAHTGQAGQLVQRKERHPSQDFAQRPGDQTVQPQAWRRHQKWSPK